MIVGIPRQCLTSELGRTEITDTGLKHLREMAKLKAIELVGNELTGEGLVDLERMTNLKELKLHKTKVTDAGVADLEKSLPNGKIAK